MVNCLTDATDRHRLVDRVVATERVLALGQMASGLVHEISHPIVTILMSLETMIRRLRCQPPDLDDLEARLCRSRRLADRAPEVLSHLAWFGRVDPTLFTFMNVQDVMEGAVAACADSLAEIGMKAHITVTTVNEPAVWIVACVVGGTAEISVRDNAGGIPEAMLTNIFDPFYTTKPAGPGGGSGMGLGLALARGYLRCQGGDLTARNSEDGALFVLSLPAVGRTNGTDQPHTSRRNYELAPATRLAWRRSL